MQIQLLGPVELSSGNGTLALGGPKPRALLAMLALDTGSTVSAERLIDGLWGEEPPATAATEVRDTRTGRVVARLETGDNGRSVAFSHDGELLAIGHYGGSARLVSTRTWKPVGRTIDGHEARLSALEFSPDGRVLATGSADGTVLLWTSTRSGRSARRWRLSPTRRSPRPSPATAGTCSPCRTLRAACAGTCAPSPGSATPAWWRPAS